MPSITGFKLMRRRRDGTLAPLFINRSMTVPVGEWLKAENHPTKGYAERHGWHACVEQDAPHLAKSPDRVWCRVELADFRYFDRPAAQGGKWILANNMKVLEVIG